MGDLDRQVPTKGDDEAHSVAVGTQGTDGGDLRRSLWPADDVVQRYRVAKMMF